MIKVSKIKISSVSLFQNHPEIFVATNDGNVDVKHDERFPILSQGYSAQLNYPSIRNTHQVFVKYLLAVKKKSSIKFYFKISFISFSRKQASIMGH